MKTKMVRTMIMVRMIMVSDADDVPDAVMRRMRRTLIISKKITIRK